MQAVAGRLTSGSPSSTGPRSMGPCQIGFLGHVCPRSAAQTMIPSVIDTTAAARSITTVESCIASMKKYLRAAAPSCVNKLHAPRFHVGGIMWLLLLAVRVELQTSLAAREFRDNHQYVGGGRRSILLVPYRALRRGSSEPSRPRLRLLPRPLAMDGMPPNSEIFATLLDCG